MMELLQTIWTALTTENEFLTSLMIIPLTFIDAYVLMFLFITILNIDATRKRKLLYLFIVSIFRYCW